MQKLANEINYSETTFIFNSKDPEDILDNLPVEEVSTGFNILIIPVKNLAAIQKATNHIDNMNSFFKNRNSLAPYVTLPPKTARILLELTKQR